MANPGLSNSRDAGIKATRKVREVKTGDTIKADDYNKLVRAVNGLLDTLVSLKQVQQPARPIPQIYCVQADAGSDAVEVSVKKWRKEDGATEYSGEPHDVRYNNRSGNDYGDGSPPSPSGYGETITLKKHGGPMFAGDLVVAGKGGDGFTYAFGIYQNGAQASKIPADKVPGARDNNWSATDQTDPWSRRNVPTTFGESLDGFTVPIVTWIGYDSTLHKLQFFTRDFTFNSKGELVAMGVEVTNTAFTAVDCSTV